MNRKGFTLIEVLIAVVLLSLAVISLGQFMGKFASQVIAERTDTCSAAYERALSSYRAAGVVRLVRNP